MLVFLCTTTLQSHTVSLSLKHHWSNKALDLGCLVPELLAFLLGKRTLDHVLTNVVLLGQVEQLPDFGSSLRAQSTGNVHVGQSGDFRFSTLDNGE